MLLIISSCMNYFLLSQIIFFIWFCETIFRSYHELFLPQVLRIIFFIVLIIIFGGISILYFGLHYIAGLSLTGTSSSAYS